MSLKELKPDAIVFNEMILDVDIDYFKRNDDYNFACRFYEEPFHFTEKLYGKDNIISAVMHIDKLNIAMTEKYCKDPTLVETVKEVIHQVSHSNK